MKLEDLGGAYDRLQLDLALQSAIAGAPDLIPRVQKLSIPTIPSGQRAALADGVYSCGTTALANTDFNKALVAFRLAQKLVPQQQIFVNRAKMLERAIAERKLVSWRASLISLQRKLGVVCTKKVLYVHLARADSPLQEFDRLRPSAHTKRSDDLHACSLLLSPDGR